MKPFTSSVALGSEQRERPIGTSEQRASVRGASAQTITSRYRRASSSVTAATPSASSAESGASAACASGAATSTPGNPLADKDGFVYLSNVNEMTEMVEMMAASRSYANNVEVINTTRQLLMRTIDITRS